MAPLHLIADSDREAQVVSALIQDAILSSADVRRDTRLGHIALLLSRYRWEDTDGRPSRVRSLLVVREVKAAARMNWPAEAQPLELLALRLKDRMLRIDFAGGAALRIEVAGLRLALEDIGDPWPVHRAPRHAG